MLVGIDDVDRVPRQLADLEILDVPAADHAHVWVAGDRERQSLFALEVSSGLDRVDRDRNDVETAGLKV